MGSKLIFSAPKRSISYWSLAAISCSVMPGWINFRISEKARSVISWAFVIRAISPSSLAARRASTSFWAGTSSAVRPSFQRL